MAAVGVNRVLERTLPHWKMSHTHTKSSDGSHACKLVTLASTQISISQGAMLATLICHDPDQSGVIAGTDCLCDQSIGHTPKAAKKHQSSCKVSAAWHALVPPNAEGLLFILHRGCHSDGQLHEALVFACIDLVCKRLVLEYQAS